MTSDDPPFCWEHAPQAEVRSREVRTDEEWRPMGSHTLQKPKESADRLKVLAADEQNVHTPEVQCSVSDAIRRLHAWATKEHIRTEHDLVAKILKRIGTPRTKTQFGALDYLRQCYKYSDDTRMFGVTYPALSSWVWARCVAAKNPLILDRFFEEVFESTGQCLNGNMSRLMNVFAVLDPEMSPQDSADALRRDHLPNLIAAAVNSDKDIGEVIHLVQDLLQRAQVPSEEWGIWIDAVFEARDI